MCLAVPGLIVCFEPRDDAPRLARVDFGGLRSTVCVEWLPEARIGDYVMVHAGFAISIVDPAEAAETLRMIREIGGTVPEQEAESP